MEVIWVKREQRYFCGGGWTGKSLFSWWRDFAVIDVILLKFSQGVVHQHAVSHRWVHAGQTKPR
jgi:hypothetical protein